MSELFDKIDLAGKHVLVSGGTSMIGRNVVKSLEKRGAIVDNLPHSECDLLNDKQVRERFFDVKPNYVIHAAAFSGGITYNKKFPASIYYQTVQMGLNILTECALSHVEKVVSILPSCSYSYEKDGETRILLKEENFEQGPPHDSIFCHGAAKRVLFDYSRQLHKQFGLNYVCCVLNNSYGPFDSFDINKTKVVGSLIKKFVDAKRSGAAHVEVFGTGAARREFIFCEDAGEGIVRTLESYNDPTLPINLGGGDDITIKELAEEIKGVVGYEGDIKFLTEYPDGQLKKLLDNTRTLELLDWRPTTSFRDGLVKTIRWYMENY